MHFETSSSTKVYVENTERVVFLKNETATISDVNTEIVGFFKEAISKN